MPRETNPLTDLLGPVPIRGGIDATVPVHDLPNEVPEELWNLDFDGSGRVRARPGSVFYSRIGRGPVLFIGTHSFETGLRSSKTVAVVASGLGRPNPLTDPSEDGEAVHTVGFCTDVRSRAPLLDLRARESDRFEMASFLDRAWIAGSTLDHRIRSFDFASDEFTSIEGVRGTSVEAFGGRLFVGGDPVVPNQVFASNPDEPENFDLPGIQIGSRNAKIKVLTSSGGLLIIFTDSSVHWLAAGAIELGELETETIGGGGGLGGKLAWSSGSDGFLYWLSGSGPKRWQRGLGAADQTFSAPIRHFFDTVGGDLSSAVVWDDQASRAMRFLLPSRGSDYPDYLLSYFYERDVWTHGATGANPKIVARLRDRAARLSLPLGQPLYTAAVPFTDPLSGERTVLAGDQDGILWRWVPWAREKIRQWWEGADFRCELKYAPIEVSPIGYRGQVHQIKFDTLVGREFLFSVFVERDFNGKFFLSQVCEQDLFGGSLDEIQLGDDQLGRLFGERMVPTHIGTGLWRHGLGKSLRVSLVWNHTDGPVAIGAYEIERSLAADALLKPIEPQVDLDDIPPTEFEGLVEPAGDEDSGGTTTPHPPPVMDTDRPEIEQITAIDQSDSEHDVFNVADPANPLLMLRLDEQNGEDGASVEASGEYVVSWNVFTGTDSIKGIRMWDMKGVKIASSVIDSVLQGALDVTVEGTVAYVISEIADTLTTIDISDPENPVILDSSAGDLSSPKRIIVQDGIAYVLDSGLGGVVFYDVSDPANIALINAWSDPAFVNPFDFDINALATLAFVADKNADLLISVDISDPAAPAVISQIGGGFNGHRTVVLRGNEAFVGIEFDDTLVSFDVSDPVNMSVIQAFAPGGNFTRPWRMDLFGDDSFLCVAARSGDAVFSVDITDPADMFVVGEWQQDEADNVEWVNVRGSLVAAMADRPTNTVWLIDFADLANPKTLGRLWTRLSPGDSRDAQGLYLGDEFLYICENSTDALVVADVRDPVGPVFLWKSRPLIDLGLLNSTNVEENFSNYIRQRNRIYMAARTTVTNGDSEDSRHLLVVVDQPDPTQPPTAILSSASLSSGAGGIAGPPLILSDGLTGFVAHNFDFGSGATPALTSFEVSPDGSVLNILDVIPLTPAPGGGNPGFSREQMTLNEDENRLLLTSDQQFVSYLMDISNSSSLVQLDSWQHPNGDRLMGAEWGRDTTKQYGFVLNRDNSNILIFDFSADSFDLANEFSYATGQRLTGHQKIAVWPNGRYLMLHDRRIFDITDPPNPVEIGRPPGELDYNLTVRGGSYSERVFDPSPPPPLATNFAVGASDQEGTVVFYALDDLTAPEVTGFSFREALERGRGDAAFIELFASGQYFAKIGSEKLMVFGGFGDQLDLVGEVEDGRAGSMVGGDQEDQVGWVGVLPRSLARVDLTDPTAPVLEPEVEVQEEMLDFIRPIRVENGRVLDRQLGWITPETGERDGFYIDPALQRSKVIGLSGNEAWIQGGGLDAGAVSVVDVAAGSGVPILSTLRESDFGRAISASSGRRVLFSGTDRFMLFGQKDTSDDPVVVSVDASDTSAVVIQGEVSDLAAALGGVLNGTDLWVVTSKNVVAQIDVSDPANPQLTGTWAVDANMQTTGSWTPVVFHQGHLIVALQPGGDGDLRIGSLDPLDPTTFVQIQSLAGTEHSLLDMGVLSGDRLAIVTRGRVGGVNARIQVVDASSPGTGLPVLEDEGLNFVADDASIEVVGERAVVIEKGSGAGATQQFSLWDLTAVPAEQTSVGAQPLQGMRWTEAADGRVLLTDQKTLPLVVGLDLELIEDSVDPDLADAIENFYVEVFADRLPEGAQGGKTVGQRRWTPTADLENGPVNEWRWIELNLASSNPRVQSEAGLGFGDEIKPKDLVVQVSWDQETGVIGLPDGRLQFWDIATVNTASLLGEITLPAVPSAIRQSGTDPQWTVLSAGTGRLMVVDAADPTDPQMIGDTGDVSATQLRLNRLEVW